MNISLIPQDSTLTAALSLVGTMEFSHGERRMSRHKLVTGSVKIVDKGQTHKDRTANMTLTLTSVEDEQTLEYWHTNGTGLWFSDSLGCYKAEIFSLNILNEVASVELWITSLIVSSVDYIYPPAPNLWVDKTSDTFWTTYSGGAFTAVWNGSAWIINGPASFQFIPVGGGTGWNQDYTPSKARFTFTDTGTSLSTLSFYGSPSGGGSQSILDTYAFPAPVSMQAYDINYAGSAQLAEIIIGASGFGGLSISKIEFYEG